MFLVDTVQKRIISDAEIKKQLAARQPYASGSRSSRSRSTNCPSPRASSPPIRDAARRQRAFGYSEEDLRMICSAPWARKGRGAGRLHGHRHAAGLPLRPPQPLFNYFKQLFAQVTNPPIDPIREELVMSLISYIGTERNILDEAPENCHTLKLPHPILTNRDLEKLRRVSRAICWPPRCPRSSAPRMAKRACARARRPEQPRRARRQLRLHAADPLRPRRRSHLRAHPQPAGHGRRAQPPGARKTRTQVALIIESASRARSCTSPC
jgi:hypothetical protein